MRSARRDSRSARRESRSARRGSRSARRDSRLFFQTFQTSFVISWRISTNEPSLESLRSQKNDGAIFVPVSPMERTIAPFLRRILTLSAQFPRIHTCSGQINLYKGKIVVDRKQHTRDRSRSLRSLPWFHAVAIFRRSEDADRLKIVIA